METRIDRRLVSAISIISLFVMAIMSPAHAQDPAEGIFRGALAIYQSAQSKPADEQTTDYVNVRRLLDLIVKDYSESDLSVRILLQDNIDGLDVSDVDQKLALASSAAVSQPTVSTAQPSTVPMPALSEREIVKEIQSELNRLGCGAGKADGVVGQRTRAALDGFNLVVPTPSTVDSAFTMATLGTLRGTIDPVCSSRWQITNRPNLLAGIWGYRADCKTLFRTIRITGSITLNRNASGQFSGSAHNSLGERGSAFASISGTRVQTNVKYPRQSITASLNTSTKSTSLSGRDSNGCTIVAWKN